MQSTNIPSKIPLPFAYAAGGSYIRTIPAASQIGITAGAASLRDGFPPVTFSPIGSGGTPPFGQDVNGILNEITAIQQWQEAGGFFAYDSTFSTTIGGYPKGAILQSTSFNGFWTSTAENNTTNPDTGGAGWVATAFEGLETIPTTGGTTTLTNLQAAYPIISITGALTSNAIITMPNIVGSWIIANNTTGSYTLAIKTAAGTGIPIAQSYSAMCYGDATNIYYSDSAVAIAANTALTNSNLALNAITQGIFTNLNLSANGTTAAVNVSANSLVVTTSGNLAYQLKSVSLTANTGGTSGAANSLDAGAWAYSTWYYVHVIYNTSTTTQALLFSLSATAPTLPSGYTAFARVGSIRTQSATNYNPLAFTQYGRNVQYLVGASGNVTTYPVMTSGVQGTITTTSYTPISVTTKNTYVPPTASILKFILTNSYGAGGAPYPVVASPSTNFSGVTTAMQPPASIYVGASLSTMYSFTLESNNIYYASQSANGAIYAIGWEDNL